MPDDLKWQIVNQKDIVNDEWMRFETLTYAFPDGTTFGPYYEYHIRDYVIVVARTSDDQYVLVHQFRHGVRQMTEEFVAGAIDEGEDPFFSAKRELEEESGYTSDYWTHITTLYPDPTRSDHKAYLYFADDCHKTTDTHTDATEFLSAYTADTQQIEEMISNQTFLQAMHILAWYQIRRFIYENNTRTPDKTISKPE